MQVGDKVELRKPLAHLRPGARGTIIAIDDNNFITVRSSHDEEGRESDFILPPQTSDFFKLEGTEGPATEEPQG